MSQLATIDEQSPSGSYTGLLARALEAVPRNAFTADEAHPHTVGRSLPSKAAATTLIEALELHAKDRVLHIGTGAGYLPGLLATLCKEVHSVEQLEVLAATARKRLQALGITNCRIHHADGFQGWPEDAPFAAILVSAQCAGPPTRLLTQLEEGGRLVFTDGDDRHCQRLVRMTRNPGGRFAYEELGEVDFSANDDPVVPFADADPHGKDPASATMRLPAVSQDEKSRFKALAIQHGMRSAEAEVLLRDSDPHLFERIPRAFCDHNRMLPLAMHGRSLRVAVSNPDAPVADLAKVLGAASVDTYLVTPAEFRRIWQTLELRLSRHHAVAGVAGVQGAVHDLLHMEAGHVDARLITLFETLLLEAIGERASDIHLERYGDEVRVRLRIDGELRQSKNFQLSPGDLLGLVNVIKIRANMDIAERRLPQGGRIHLRSGDQVFDLRVQTQPALHGEHVIVRILPQDNKVLTVEDLGYPPDLAADYRRLLKHPAGLLLVVGPTGSGKSTSLYAGLQQLAADQSRKVITVEDPIEYAIEGIQQTQVHPAIGFHFADAMRAFVREDPDVILVGEIRDGETALEAIRASQTGHLVLSTLHSNDTVDAVQRLYDLGMHPNSISSELLAVIAQRLAKRVCLQCRREVAPEQDILNELFPRGAPSDFRCFAGAGCEACSGRGTHSRIAVTEFLRLGPEVRNAIAHQPALDELRAMAIEAGLRTMRDSAVALVKQGLVPLAELQRILPAERMAPEG